MTWAPQTVLITGAAGNLGSKLARHLLGRYSLRLLDREPQGDPEITIADLAIWNTTWVDRFAGVDGVVHLAADPLAHQSWPNLIGPNMDATIHTYRAAALHGVRRFIFASSNHVLGGYSSGAQLPRLGSATPPRPGAQYTAQGEYRDSTPYASTKLFGERLGACHAQQSAMSVLALRLGWNKPGANRAAEIPPERGPWFRLMWLSNRDYCHLLDVCLTAPLSISFAILNGMSANTGMPWDIEEARQLVGYNPQDDVTRPEA